MGIILAKFRKEKTTYEILEALETKIKDIESFSISTQARQKRFVGNFLVFSVGLYVIASVVFYFAFFPSTWSKRAIYSTPLLIFPILILFLKRLVAWYFQRKINRNANQLKKLRTDKKKILEQVMDKETYKIACEILNRFGDATIRSQHQSTTSNSSPSQSPVVTSLVTPQRQQLNRAVTPQTMPRPSLPTARTPINIRSVATPIKQTPQINHLRISSPIDAKQQFSTPFPIINQNRKGIFEKIVDYLINDGPSSRYGMICKECYGHNGMVSQEEYEYSAFKCAFCKALNPAKKIRPIAPRLILPDKGSGDATKILPPIKSQSSDLNVSAPISDKDSGSESDAISSELRNRKNVEIVESNERKVEQTTATQPIAEHQSEENPNEENVKTHIDKKNE